MKVKQKNIRCFHLTVENREEFFSYFNKNLTLLKNYFLILEGNIEDDIIEFLEKNLLCYKIIDENNRKIFAQTQNSKKDSEQLAQEFFNQNKNQKLEKKIKKVKIFDRTIRSGEEIFSEDDIIINGRVNSGAKVVCNSNIIINDKIDGFVEGSGEYMILKNIGNGVVSLNKEAIELNSSDKLKLIYSKQGELVIKEIK